MTAMLGHSFLGADLETATMRLRTVKCAPVFWLRLAINRALRQRSHSLSELEVRFQRSHKYGRLAFVIDQLVEEGLIRKELRGNQIWFTRVEFGRKATQ
jgi:hypothetical protein